MEPLAIAGRASNGTFPLLLYKHHSIALSAAYNAPMELVASVIVLMRGTNILVKVKVMASIAESINKVKIIIEPLCMFN